MYDEINRQAFNLVSLLDVKEIAKVESKPQPQKPLRIGEEPPIDLGEVKNLKLIKRDPYGATVSVFQTVDSKRVGYNEEKYALFSEVIGKIHELAPFSSKASYSFLEEKGFKWIMQTFILNQAEKSLTDYLLDEIEENYREYNFFYKVEPLIITSPFKIGGIEIGHFTEEFLAEEKEKFLKLGKPIKEFDDLFSRFRNSALVKIKVKGVADRAAELAMQQGEHIIDVLKCLLHEFSVYGQYVMPELAHRVNTRKPSIALYNYPSVKFTFGANISNQGPVIPIEIDEKRLEEFKKNKIELFDKFLANRKDNEFYYAVSDAIRSFGEITATLNKYEKIVKLISFFEAIIIDKTGKRGRGETDIKGKLIPKLLHSESDIKLGIELTGYFYRIRDAYIHHRIEKHVDFLKLFRFQTIAFRFIHYLIKLNDKVRSWDQFFEILNKE